MDIRIKRRVSRGQVPKATDFGILVAISIVQDISTVFNKFYQMTDHSARSFALLISPSHWP